ncbi:DUF4381 domain-containing protein [Thaumasiovibrio sp. DFM-14]|uniref:DUF4381 domain-containing protein n=1 Tax=Thaumasiovibrio sp. DFM-14 TaxID=3384792 RepID=UPI0039A333A3
MDNALPLDPIIVGKAPSLWPLPVAFWCITLLCVIAIVAVIRWALKRQRANKARREALAQLHQLSLSKQPNLSALNSLLRRTALSYFAREEVAPLHGEAWLAWLDQQVPNKQLASSTFSDLQAVWLQGLYTTQPLDSNTWQTCLATAIDWTTSFSIPKTPRRRTDV